MLVYPEVLTVDVLLAAGAECVVMRPEVDVRTLDSPV